jgi:CheY-like chemotaxis protein
MAATQVQPLRGARILVAEDNALLAFDMASLLKKAGAEVLGPATTLRATLAFAKEAVLNCAVLDVNLGRDTVFSAARVLKERGVRMIFHTGHGEWEMLQQEWPGAQVLTKPAPSSLLIRAVCEACVSAGFGAIPDCPYCRCPLQGQNTRSHSAD